MKVEKEEYNQKSSDMPPSSPTHTQTLWLPWGLAMAADCSMGGAEVWLRSESPTAIMSDQYAPLLTNSRFLGTHPNLSPGPPRCLSPDMHSVTQSALLYNGVIL